MDFKHLFASLVSKFLETDGLRTIVQYDIVGVRHTGLHKRIYFYACLLQLFYEGLILIDEEVEGTNDKERLGEPSELLRCGHCMK